MDKQYILYGAGVVGKRLLHRLGKDKVAYFCDNNKRGETIGEVPVISTEELSRIHSKYTVVVSVEKKCLIDEICGLLRIDNIPWIGIMDLYDQEHIDLTKVKHEAELEYWSSNLGINERTTTDSYYRNFILSILEETPDFFDDKVVADFGCGPRGSLTWMNSARERIGIDVLSKEYLSEFGAEILSHNMVYVTSNERYIPIPAGYIDCLITINALDHVTNLSDMCEELKRILKPGGLLIASFNLFEPKTECEPQTLTEKNLKNYLLSDFDIDSYRLSRMDEKDTYVNLKAGIYVDEPDGSYPCGLWVKARKKVNH